MKDSTDMFSQNKIKINEEKNMIDIICTNNVKILNLRLKLFPVEHNILFFQII